MITVLPKDRDDILEKENIKNSDNITVLLCEEDEKEKGYVVFNQDGYVINILSLKVYANDENSEDIGKVLPKDAIYYDSILRSVGSYALNHSCFYVKSECLELLPILSQFRFDVVGDKAETTLQKLLGH